jgi:carboxylesterase
MRNKEAILPGAEPYYKEGSKVGILLIHGLTASPQSMRYLAERYTEAGLSVAMPRLTGHGTSPADLATATARDWMADIQQALAWLQVRCTSLFVSGSSIGGTLSLLLAGLYPPLFQGVIPINAGIFVNNSNLVKFAFLPDAPTEVHGVSGDVKQEGASDNAYPVLPTAVLQHAAAIFKVTEEMLPCIVCPALIVTSRVDHVVPPTNGLFIYERIASEEKRLLWLEDSYHFATVDNDKDRIVEETLTFVQTHTAS